MIYRLTGMIAGFARWVEKTEIGFFCFAIAGIIAVFLGCLGIVEGRY